MEIADDDEYVWTTSPLTKSNPLHKGLQEFESCLRCQICGSFYQSPVSIHGCFHTFCSECIRGTIRIGRLSLRRMAVCPICRAPIEGNENDSLIRNPSVEEMVNKFRNVRANLIVTLTTPTVSPPTPPKLNDETQSQSVPSPAIDSRDRDETGPTTRRNGRTRHLTHTLPPADVATDATDKREDVSHSIAVSLQQQAPLQPRKKLPKTFYNGMKRKKLQEKCRELGLSDRGTDQELKTRHQDYVNLYNAECDSSYPRSAEELVKLIHDREHAIREEEYKAKFSGVSDHTLHLKRIKDARKAVGEGLSVEVVSGNSAFDTMFNDGFKNLCAQLKKRKMGETSGSTADNSTASEKAKEGSDVVVPTNEDSGVHDVAPLVHKGTPNDSTTDGDKENLPRVGSSMEGSSNLGERRKYDNSHVEDTDDIVVVASSSPLDRKDKCSPMICHQTAAVLGINSSCIAVAHQDDTQHLPRIPAQKEFSSYQHNGGDNSHDTSIVMIQPTLQLSTTPKSATASTTPHVTPRTSHDERVGVELVAKPHQIVVPPRTIERRNESMTSQQQRMNKRIKTNRSSNMTATTSQSTVGPWNCLTCTFYNTVRIGSRSKCEMCESPRPSPSNHMSY